MWQWLDKVMRSAFPFMVTGKQRQQSCQLALAVVSSDISLIAELYYLPWVSFGIDNVMACYFLFERVLKYPSN